MNQFILNIEIPWFTWHNNFYLLYLMSALSFVKHFIWFDDIYVKQKLFVFRFFVILHEFYVECSMHSRHLLQSKVNHKKTHFGNNFPLFDSFLSCLFLFDSWVLLVLLTGVNHKKIYSFFAFERFSLFSRTWNMFSVCRFAHNKVISSSLRFIFFAALYRCLSFVNISFCFQCAMVL